MSTTHRAANANRYLHLLATAGLVLVGAASLTLAVGSTAAVFASGEQRPNLTVTRTSEGKMAGLVPGQHATLTFDVRADVEVVYAFDASISGTGPLANQLVTSVHTSSGEILYSGPLATAAFSGRALPAGSADLITVDVEIPLRRRPRTPRAAPT